MAKHPAKTIDSQRHPNRSQPHLLLSCYPGHIVMVPEVDPKV